MARRRKSTETMCKSKTPRRRKRRRLRLQDLENTVRMTSNRKRTTAHRTKLGPLLELTQSCLSVQIFSIPPRGVELPSQTPQNSAPVAPRGAQNGALAAPPQINAQIDVGLVAVIQAWARLPEAIRAGILALVRAADSTTNEVFRDRTNRCAITMRTSPAKLQMSTLCRRSCNLPRHFFDFDVNPRNPSGV